MLEALLEVRLYLTARYRSLKGGREWDFIESSSGPVSDVSWLWQNSDLSITSDSDNAQGAAILDPEIGVCLYVIRFDVKVPVRNQLARALKVRSHLLPDSRLNASEIDSLGSWRVVVYWLVKQSEMKEWVHQIADIRQHTAHFEEIPVDAVICGKSDWFKACTDHGFPRLLFETRSIFFKEKNTDIVRWQSADAKVSEALSGLEYGFRNELERTCARSVTELISTVAGEQKSSSPDVAPLDLFSLSISDFRNINKLKIDFRAPSETVASTVVEGPNGSGKSSVYEALSIAVCGASSRYMQYLSDSNRQIWGRSDRYVNDYLSGMSTADTIPGLALNDEELKPIQLAEAENAQDRLTNLNGTFLPQESSRSLVAMSASDLGAEIASSFSTIAEKVTERVEAGHSAALAKQKAFNSRWSLRLNVTRRETVIEQISARLISRILPNFESVNAWLRSDNLISFEISESLNRLAEKLSSVTMASNSVPKEIAVRGGHEGSASVIGDYLRAVGQATQDVGAELQRIRDATASWSTELVDQLEKWGSWLADMESPMPVTKDTKFSELKEIEEHLSRQIQESARLGRLVADRTKHLESISAFIDVWAEHDAATCPVCNSNVEDRGGIRIVASDLRERLAGDLQALRADYTKIRADLAKISTELSKYGAASPPFTAEERAEITSNVSWILPKERDLRTILRNPNERNGLKQVVTHLLLVPDVPKIGDAPQLLADSIATEIQRSLKEYDEVSNLPAAWKAVRQAVLGKLSQVTSEHLPQTLQALWSEIAQNMISAPWQYPGWISLKMRVRRATPEAAVVIRNAQKEALAQHILNSAEVHNLGLAWFFTRYLTSGRFRYRFIVLDDPAHSMDQPTYRDFCRFLETLLRLHKLKKRPLSLFILLHQGSRALDAARETEGVLHLLRWNRKTPLIFRRFKLYGEQFHAPQPGAKLLAG